MSIQAMKDQIDRMSYEGLLSRWRFAPAGDPFFQGEVGDYYSKVMKEKRLQCDHVAASKSVGLEQPNA